MIKDFIKDLEDRKKHIEKMSASEAFAFFGETTDKLAFLWGMQHAITCLKIKAKVKGYES